MAFIALPIYTRVFSPGEYGAITVVTTILGLVLSVLMLGGDSAFSIYWFQSSTERERQALTSTVVISLVSLATVSALVLLPLSGPAARLLLGTDTYTELVVLLLVIVPVGIANRILGQILRNEFRVAALSVVNVASAAIMLVTSLLGIHLGLGVDAVLVGTLAGEGATLVPRLLLVRSAFARTFRRELVRGLLAYGLPLVATAVSYWIFMVSDRLVLAKLSTLDEVGLYGVANTVAAPLLIAIGVVGQAISPHALRIYTEDPEEASRFLGTLLTYILAAFGTACVALIAFAPELVRLFSGPAFYGARRSIPALGLALVALASSYVTAVGMYFTRRTKYLAVYSGCAAVLNVALCVALIPRFGQVGAAWSTTVAYLFLTLAYLRRSQALWPAAYQVRSVVKILVLLVVFSAVAGQPWGSSSIVGLAGRAVLCGLFVAGLVLSRAVDWPRRGAPIPLLAEDHTSA